MNYVGIDPGLKGGIAILTPTGKLKNLVSMPTTINDKYQLFKTFNEKDKIYVEKVHSMPHDSRRGAFTFGYHLAELHTLLWVLNLNYTNITPRDWQTSFGCKREKGQSKYDYKRSLRDRAEENLQRLSRSKGLRQESKQSSIRLEYWTKQLTLNTCDAYLIALYAYQKEKNEKS